jgi:hypothetical protein
MNPFRFSQVCLAFCAVVQIMMCWFVTNSSAAEQGKNPLQGTASGYYMVKGKKVELNTHKGDPFSGRL